MSTIEVVGAAFVHGLALSVALGAVVVGSLRLNAETWLKDYPPDIREAFGPMSERARRQRVPFAALFGIIMVGAVALGLAWLLRTAGAPGFIDIFLYVLVLGTTFNAFDLLVLDWLWFIKLQPSWIILPGTDGLAGYQDYAFHFRAFLVGLAGTTILALLIAGITVVVR